MATDDPHNVEAARETPEAQLGRELRRLRVRAGLSGRRLAEELHRGQSSIAEYELGQRLPSVEVVEQYEEFFGLAPGTLIAQRERARVERLEWPKDATVDDDLGDDACPYKGLRAFEYEDAALFFGRESQVEAVLARLAEVRFVAVVGASGSGKSSFVRAGLLAGIRATWPTSGARARVVVLTPGEHPVDELADAVSAVSGDARRAAANDLRADPDRLRWAAGDAGLVIVVDQFEELFTLCGDEGERRCFVDALIAAWRYPASPVVVILALRADFYGRVALYPELAAAVVGHQTLIGPMSQTDLRRAIELPAANTGLLLQPGLAETLLEDLGDEPGALPLLSHALLETWERRRRLTLTVGGYREAGGVRGAIALTAERILQSLPEADRSIARRIVLTLTDIGEASEPTRRRVDRAELDAHPHDATSVDRVLGVLADARLVTIDERTVVVAHEALIRHWPRLRAWIEADRADLLLHRRLADAARQWDTLNRESGALYRGARLAAAREWATNHADHLSQLERDFLTVSQATRQRHIRGAFAGLLTALLVVSALAVIALIQANRAADQRDLARSRELASEAARLVEKQPDLAILLGLQSLSMSHGQASGQPAPSLVTALSRVTHASMRFPVPHPLTTVASNASANLLVLGDARGVVRVSRLRGGKLALRTVTERRERVNAVAISPNGRFVASASGDEAPSASPDDVVQLWETTGRGRHVRTIGGFTAWVSGIEFSADSRLLAATTADQDVSVRDTTTGRETSSLRGTGGTIALSPTNRRLLASLSNDCANLDETAPTDQGCSVELWDVGTGRKLGQLPKPASDWVRALEFTPNGRLLASASMDGTIRIWNVARKTTLASIKTTHGSVHSLAFSQDSKILFSGNDDGTVEGWTLRPASSPGTPLPALDNTLAGYTASVTGLTLIEPGHTLASASSDRSIRFWQLKPTISVAHTLLGNKSYATSVAFDPSGGVVASGGEDATVRLWDTSHGFQARQVLEGHAARVTALAFSRDGRLASAGADRTIRVWDPRTSRPLRHTTERSGHWVNSVAFSPRGDYLASGSSDTTVTVWDSSGRPIGRPITGNRNIVNSVDVDRSGAFVASGDSDGKVIITRIKGRRKARALAVGDVDCPGFDGDRVIRFPLSRD